MTDLEHTPRRVDAERRRPGTMPRATAPVAVAAVLSTAGCSHSPSKSGYGTAQVRVGESQRLVGWNVSVANLRWNGD